MSDGAIHISAALLFSEMIDQCWRGSNSPYRDSSNDEKFLTLGDTILLLSEQIASPSRKTSFLFSTASIIWFDIVNSASLRKDPRLTCCLDTLCNSNVNFEPYFRCEPHVLQLLGKVCELDSWKRVMDASGCLSLTELVARATPFRQALSHFVKREGTDAKRSSAQAPFLVQTNSHVGVTLTVDTISKITASATLIYLEIVVSGARPLIPEIRAAMVDAIALLEQTPAIDILRHVTWPICVIGCMAQTSQRDTITRLATVINASTERSLQKALRVVEETWKIQDDQGIPCDWTPAMAAMGFASTFI